MSFLCIDPAWEPGTPKSEEEADWFGFRFVAQPELFDAVCGYINRGFHVMLVLAKESGDPQQYADWGPFDFGEGPMLHWTVGNEPDGDGPSSWIMDPDEYAALWESAKCLQGDRYIAGMCSGDVDRAATYLPWDVEEAGLMVHLYGLSPDDANAKLAEYQTLGVPVWVGEWHQADGYGSYDYDFGDVWNNYFCYSNAMVDGMGLV